MAVASAEPGSRGAQDASAVRVEVIGAGAVRRGDAAVTGLGLGGRRARVALAALALADGPLPAGRLAAMIWPDNPPPTWPVALGGVIRALRAALEPAGAGGQLLIVTTPSGYRLAHDASVDLDLMEASLAESAALAAAGTHETAIGTAPAGARGGLTARVPQPSSAFFGREAESAALAAALRDPGLVTVTGPGCAGKTRLVMQVARAPATAAALSGGPLWVSLAAV